MLFIKKTIIDFFLLLFAIITFVAFINLILMVLYEVGQDPRFNITKPFNAGVLLGTDFLNMFLLLFLFLSVIICIKYLNVRANYARGFYNLFTLIYLFFKGLAYLVIGLAVVVGGLSKAISNFNDLLAKKAKLIQEDKKRFSPAFINSLKTFL